MSFGGLEERQALLRERTLPALPPGPVCSGGGSPLGQFTRAPSPPRPSKAYLHRPWPLFQNTQDVDLNEKWESLLWVPPPGPALSLLPFTAPALLSLALLTVIQAFGREVAFSTFQSPGSYFLQIETWGAGGGRRPRLVNLLIRFPAMQPGPGPSKPAGTGQVGGKAMLCSHTTSPDMRPIMPLPSECGLNANAWIWPPRDYALPATWDRIKTGLGKKMVLFPKAGRAFTTAKEGKCLEKRGQRERDRQRERSPAML